MQSSLRTERKITTTGAKTSAIERSDRKRERPDLDDSALEARRQRGQTDEEEELPAELLGDLSGGEIPPLHPDGRIAAEAGVGVNGELVLEVIPVGVNGSRAERERLRNLASLVPLP